MIEQISPKEAYKKIQEEGAIYLDVRTPAEFKESHAKGAINIPIRIIQNGFMHMNANFIDEVKNTFEDNTTFVVGCKTGGRSQIACEVLLSNEFTHIFNINGGFMGKEGAIGWMESGLPVNK